MTTKKTTIYLVAAIIVGLAVFFMLPKGKVAVPPIEQPAAGTSNKSDNNSSKTVTSNPVTSGASTQKSNGTATNFSYVGTLIVPKVLSGQPVPTLSYNEPAWSTTPSKISLVFDSLSMCSIGINATQCQAINVTYDTIFDGKDAIVEGVKVAGKDQVLVRLIRVLNPGEPRVAQHTGSVFITWKQAQNYLNSCSVKMIKQSHTLDVYITLKNDSILRTVEPALDEVVRTIRDINGRCGPMTFTAE